MAELAEAYEDWVRQRWCENDIEKSARLAAVFEMFCRDLVAVCNLEGVFGTDIEAICHFLDSHGIDQI